MAAPLLIGDKVVIRTGGLAGKEGRVANFTPEGKIYVYVRTVNEDTPDGGLIVTQESGEFSPVELMQNGVPLTDGCQTVERVQRPANCELETEALLHPNNREGRLLYADWLAERGDPHSEYLRVQVELRDAVKGHADWSKLADRERRLRGSLDESWVDQFRELNTEPPPFDPVELDPSLAGQVRSAIRMHPRQVKSTDLTGSKFGGQFLWPADEPWPTLDWNASELDENYCFDTVPEFGVEVPLVPVVQLRSVDFPNLPFPDGTDLMQLLWCPIWGTQSGPKPRIFWRDSQQISNPQASLPSLEFAQWGLTPTECQLYPEPVLEYPNYADHEVSDSLQSAIEKWTKSFNDISQSYDYFWSQCHGCKTGGFAWINQADCETAACQTDDGRPMELLIQLSSSEINHCHWCWCPIEDRNKCFTGAMNDEDATGGFYQFSRGNYFVFVDPDDRWTVKSYYCYTS